jgi:hypothetical protein
MTIEEHIALGFTIVRVICSDLCSTVAESLRESGFGVTQMAGQSLRGPVELLEVVVLRSELPAMLQIVDRADRRLLSQSKRRAAFIAVGGSGSRGCNMDTSERAHFELPVGYYAFHPKQLFNFQLNRRHSLGYLPYDAMLSPAGGFLTSRRGRERCALSQGMPLTAQIWPRPRSTTAPPSSTRFRRMSGKSSTSSSRACFIGHSRPTASRLIRFPTKSHACTRFGCLGRLAKQSGVRCSSTGALTPSSRSSTQ